MTLRTDVPFSFKPILYDDHDSLMDRCPRFDARLCFQFHVADDSTLIPCGQLTLSIKENITLTYTSIDC